MPPQTLIEETVLDLAGAAVSLDDAIGWVTCALGRKLTTPGPPPRGHGAAAEDVLATRAGRVAEPRCRGHAFGRSTSGGTTSAATTRLRPTGFCPCGLDGSTSPSIPARSPPKSLAPSRIAASPARGHAHPAARSGE